MPVSLSGLHPQVRQAVDYALQVARQYGLHVQVTSAHRPLDKQARLYAQYQDCKRRGARIYAGNPDARCRYPANPPGASAHNYGLAFDSWVPESEWPAWNYIRAAIGFHLLPNDRVHAEMPGWRNHVAKR